MKITSRAALRVVGGLALAAPLAAQTATIVGSSTINQCETKAYEITLDNDSGNALTHVVVANNLALLVGTSYVSGSSSISVNAGPPFSTSDPTVVGSTLTWDIDALSGGPFTLNNGDVLHVVFSVRTSCSSVSGSMNAHLEYDIGGTPSSTDTALSIGVLPGAISIKKTPAVIAAEIGQNVTWTITVESTGFGMIENVRVTDLLGPGLAYVSSTPAGDNSGQTTTWDVSEIPGFASMTPGTIITIDVTATVLACQGLDNHADARWGCDAVTDCFNTATSGGTATASVQRIGRSPNLAFTPPDITFAYCDEDNANSFTITNTGDGTAHDVRLAVDFGALTVVASSAPYTTGSPGYFTLPDIAAAGTYNLEFTVRRTVWCGVAETARDLVWIPTYQDDCGNQFHAPVQLSTINPASDTSALSVTMTGAPAVIQIGDTVTYNMTSAYTGPLSCGTGGSSGTITVVDTVPNGFSLLDAGGGTWVPGAGGTGGTITWTYTPPATLSTTIVLQSPLRTECETYCYTTFSNTVTASMTDCCSCTLSATASQDSAIECEEFVDAVKTAVPLPGVRCDTVEYTNSFNFGSAGVLLNTLVFTEQAELQQQYVPGSLTVTYDGANITACVVATDTTPGGTLALDFSGCPGDMVNNKALVISYRLTLTEATTSACASASFYSWSNLEMGSIGSECLADGTIYQAVPISVEAPTMAATITGLGQTEEWCQAKTVTLTLSQTSSSAIPKDVQLVLSGLNYSVVNPVAAVCSGVAPVSCTPTIVGDDYVWTFGDGFTGSGQQATIEVAVQKRCAGTGDLVATAYFDDLCNDDATPNRTCSASATATPAILSSADLLIDKTPETFQASTSSVQWVIYLTNRGAGTAYNVWVDDLLGSGLDYQSAVVDTMTGVTIVADQDHSGSPINGATIAISQMAPGERRAITLQALLVDCDNLTNVANASWGCAGVACQPVVTDTSTVELPAPLLVATSSVTSPVQSCSAPDGMITLRNAGQATVYNAQATVTLPAGLTYVPGSTRWRLNGGGWNGPNVAYDPSPTVSPLRWTSTQIAGLATLAPGDTLEIDYDLSASCPFAGGTVTVAVSYENPCGQVLNADPGIFNVVAALPNLRITKTRVDEPIDCGQLIEWTITVENRSTYTVPIIWVEDSLDAALTFSSSVGHPPYTSDNGTVDGQVVTWEISDLPANTTATLTLRATTDSSPCSPDLHNTVRAWWGCGDPDGSSATKPGEDAPDNTLCLTSDPVTAVRTETRQPTVGFAGVSMEVLGASGQAEVTVVLQNAGPTDAFDLDLRLSLPVGLSYVAGSSRLSVGADDSGPLALIGDPNLVIPSQPVYHDLSDKGANITNLLEANGGNDTLVLKLLVNVSCFATTSMGFEVFYYDCCGDTQYRTVGPPLVTALMPDLVVTKTPTDAQISCGAQQSWTITVRNAGPAPAEVVRIEDTPGAWITVNAVASSPAPTAMPGGVWGWEINSLAAAGDPGDTATFTLVGTLNPTGYPNQNSCDISAWQNNVRAIWGLGTTGEAGDGNPNTQAYSCTYSTWSTAPVATLRMPNLVVQSVMPVITFTGGRTANGTVTVHVANTGYSTVIGPISVAVTESHDPSWTGGAVYPGNLAPGASIDLVVSTLVPTVWNPNCFPCTLQFTAVLDPLGQVCECNEADNAMTGVTNGIDLADLAVTKAATPSPVVSGEDLTYTITVASLGPNDARTVELADAIPANTTFVSATVPPGWTRTDAVPVGGVGNLTFTTPLLARAAPATLTIVVRVDPATPNGAGIPNSATATTATTEPAPDPNPNNATTTTPVTTAADLLVTKSAAGTAIAGANLTYTVGVQNLGPSDALDVVLTDDTPPNTTLISVTTPAGWTRTDSVPAGGTGTLRFTQATLAPGSSASFTIVVQVDATAPSGTNIVNTAAATSTTLDPSPDPNPNSATATTPVTTLADLWVQKGASGTGVAGDTLTYTVAVSNEGPSDAQNVALTDPTPANTTLVSVVLPAGWTRTDAVPAGGTGTLTFTTPTLAVGTSSTFTIVVRENASTPGGTSIVNTATAATATSEPAPDLHPDEATVTVQSSVLADLWMTKSVSGSALAGSDLTYTVTVRNEGPSDAQAVALSDATPASTTFVSVATPAGWTRTDAVPAGGTGTLTFTTPALPASATSIFTIVVRVAADTPLGTTIANTATATTTTQEPAPDPHPDEATATVQSAVLADLWVQKSVNGTGRAGENLTSTITVRNEGPSDAQAVALSDPTPANTTLVSVATPAGWTRTDSVVAGGTGTLTFTTPTLAVGAASAFTIVVRLNANTPSGTAVVNTASAATTTPEPAPDPHPDNATITVQSTALSDLWVTKSVSGSGLAGTDLTYTVMVRNEGPSDAQTIVLSDPTPANTTLVSVATPAGWTRTDSIPAGGTGTLTFTTPTLPASAASTFTIVAGLNANTPSGTGIVNTTAATTTTPEPAPDPHPDSATATVQSTVLADVWVQKSVSGTGRAGDTLTYTVTVRNEGPSDAQAVALSDPTPATTTLVSVATPAGWTRTDSVADGGTGTLTFTTPMLAANSTSTFTIVVRVAADTPIGTTITNTATATTTAPEPAPDPHPDEATVTVQSATLSDLWVTKSVSGSGLAGTDLTYTVTARNEGPNDAQAVALTDPIPARTTFQSATTAPGWTRTDLVAAGGTGTLSFTTPMLLASTTSTFTFIVRVVPDTPIGTTITNTATATTTTPEPVPDPHPNDAAITIGAITSADLRLTKTCSPTTLSPGQTITYTVVLDNLGPSDAQDVELTDPIPDRTTFVSATTPPGWTRADAVPDGGAGTLRFTTPVLSLGNSATFTIIVAADPNAVSTLLISNTARATTTTSHPDPDPNPDEATASADVIAAIPLLDPVGLIALLALLALLAMVTLASRRTVV
jgi:uncharacterized repeat protein (TIGR01451 family)